MALADSHVTLRSATKPFFLVHEETQAFLEHVVRSALCDARRENAGRCWVGMSWLLAAGDRMPDRSGLDSSLSTLYISKWYYFVRYLSHPEISYHAAEWSLVHCIFKGKRKSNIQYSMRMPKKTCKWWRNHNACNVSRHGRRADSPSRKPRITAMRF